MPVSVHGRLRDGRPCGLKLRPDGTLFGYFATPQDSQAALDGMSREPANARWQAEMAPFFEGAGDAADTMMERPTEVFHLD